MWVFRRFGFSDSVMDKIAFNNPYRFAAVIFPACYLIYVGRPRLLKRGEFGEEGSVNRPLPKKGAKGNIRILYPAAFPKPKSYASAKISESLSTVRRLSCELLLESL